MSRPLERFVPRAEYVMLTDCREPSCYKEAMMLKDQDKWENATIKDEFTHEE